MGVGPDNWPAAAGLMTGLMAKEAIVGTLEVLYSQTDQPGAPLPAGGAFDLAAELRTALRELAAGYGLVTGQTRGEAEGKGLLEAMRRNFGSRAAAFAYLLFVLIYSPCVAALIVLGREAGWRWMGFSVAYQTVLAWMVATAFYQAATCLDAPARAAVWLGAVAALAAGGYGLLHWAGRRMTR
jgi:ferrous iron transport protein B